MKEIYDQIVWDFKVGDIQLETWLTILEEYSRLSFNSGIYWVTNCHIKLNWHKLIKYNRSTPHVINVKNSYFKLQELIHFAWHPPNADFSQAKIVIDRMKRKGNIEVMSLPVVLMCVTKISKQDK